MKKLIYLFLTVVFMSHSIVAQVPSYVPTDGLYGYWPLDGNINDLSVNGNNGTTDGDYSTDTYENGVQSVYLEDDMIILPTNSDLNVDNFTIQFWTKAVSYNIHNKVMIADPSGPWRWAINWADSVSPLSNGEFFYYHPGDCDGTYAESGNNIDNLVSIDRDIWHLLTVVVVGQQTSFYRNGNLITVSNEASNLTCFNENMSIYFGGDVPGSIEYYNGWFDNIAIWTRSLTQQEIIDLYESEILSTNTANYESNINIYPNPANDHIAIDFGNLDNVEDWSIKIINILGQEVLSQPMNTDKINVSELSKGVYIIRISDGVNQADKKFIKN